MILLGKAVSCRQLILLAECLTATLVLSSAPVAAQAPIQLPLPQQTLDLPLLLQDLPAVEAGLPDSYILGAGDQVQVEVFRISEYSGEYEVLVNGALSLPMIGQVSVAGLSLEAAADVISQAYSQRLRRPIVNVYLINPRPLRIGIAGEVSHPGSYTLEREGTQFPTLIGALEAAGG
jgi:polysaccharide export outer membrane protein